MRLQLETEFPHILVELNDYGRYDVSFGDFDEGTDDDWTDVLASFYYKSHALEWAYGYFKKMDDAKLLVVLDRSNPIMEMNAFEDGEEFYIETLIDEEIKKGN
jgi:hypothetical protein